MQQRLVCTLVTKQTHWRLFGQIRAQCLQLLCHVSFTANYNWVTDPEAHSQTLNFQLGAQQTSRSWFCAWDPNIKTKMCLPKHGKFELSEVFWTPECLLDTFVTTCMIFCQMCLPNQISLQCVWDTKPDPVLYGGLPSMHSILDAKQFWKNVTIC